MDKSLFVSLGLLILSEIMPFIPGVPNGIAQLLIGIMKAKAAGDAAKIGESAVKGAIEQIPQQVLKLPIKQMAELEKKDGD